MLCIGPDALAEELDDLSLAECGERTHTHARAAADEMGRRCRELESLIAAAELVGSP